MAHDPLVLSVKKLQKERQMERSQTDARALSSKQAHQKPGVNTSSEKGFGLSGLIKFHDTDEM